jgi:hypothetical protein
MRKYALWKKLRSWEEKYLWLTLSSVQYEVTGKEDRKLQYSEKTRKSMCLEIMGMQWMRISGYALAESFSALITLGVISVIMFLVPLQWPWLLLRFFIKMMHAWGFKATSFTHEWSNTVANNHFTWQTFYHLKALLLDDVICWSHCCLCLEVLWVIIIM